MLSALLLDVVNVLHQGFPNWGSQPLKGLTYQPLRIAEYTIFTRKCKNGILLASALLTNET